MREITVIWDECFKWEGALSERDLPKMDGIGLYQIYGYHIIFGPGSLLYIGKTQTDFKQELINYCRSGLGLNKEADWWIKKGGIKKGLTAADVAYTCRIGRIAKEHYTDDRSHKQLLTHVEALQIYWHSPPYNSQHIEEYKGPHLYIVNKGNLGDLEAEYEYENIYL